MKVPCTKKLKLAFSSLVLLLIGLHLIWDYFHDGIPTHYILHDGDLPGFSNLWGLLILPILTWFLLSRICRRLKHLTKENKLHTFRTIAIRFSSAFSIGILLSILYLTYPDSTGYLMLALFALAFFIRLYWSEYLLGYVLATAVTFGAIIPTVAGAILLLVYALLYKVPRYIIHFLNEKIKV